MPRKKELNSFKAGALVLWLLDETQNMKVVGLNPSAIYWMDIFHIICCKIAMFVSNRPKINEKEVGDGSL